MALSVLPINYAGLGLLVLGIGMMAAEAFTPGSACWASAASSPSSWAALFLFDPAGADIDFAVAWPVVVGAAVTKRCCSSACSAWSCACAAARSVTGAEQMIGMEGRVVDWENGRGRIRVHGEVW